MEFSKLSRNHKSEHGRDSLREEGELSDDDNDEDVLKLGHRVSYTRHGNVSSSIVEKSHSRGLSRGELPHASHRHSNHSYRSSPSDKERHPRIPASSRYGKYGGRKKAYDSDRSDDDQHRFERQTSSNDVSTPSSKFWENRRFRASSVRPRTPPIKTGTQEKQNELLELVKEQERIREQLQSLEEEEKRSVTTITNVDGDDKNRSSEDEYILDMIEHFPDKQLGEKSDTASLKQDSVPLVSGLQSVELSDGKDNSSPTIDVEDISDEEDFDEQKLRILALATSARHNQLLAKGIKCGNAITKDTVNNRKEPPAKERETIVVIPDMEPIVVIADIEPERPAPEVVVVPEDEDTVRKKMKTTNVRPKKVTENKEQKSSSRDSKTKEKSRSKRKRKGSSKQETKKKSPIKKSKDKLSSKDWAQQRKVLKVLALDNPKQAMEKILKLAKERRLNSKSKPSLPKLTGTMGDFKRQKHLPLLSETQKKTSNEKRSKSLDAHEKSKKKGSAGDTQVDNYEEVEMEITSDCEEKEIPKPYGHQVQKRLNVGAEFTQAIQPVPMMMPVPVRIDTIMLPSMTPVYQAPHLPLASHSMENLHCSSILAPPLPHQPPPLPPPPPPPPPPLPEAPSPFSYSAPSSRSQTDSSSYSDAFHAMAYSYSGIEPDQLSLVDNQIHQSAEEKQQGIPPDLRLSEYYFPSAFISSVRETMSRESDKKRNEAKPLSIIDIGSQLHRLRKEQERGGKKYVSNVPEELLPNPHSDSIDISKGFWSNEDWKKTADHSKKQPRRLRSPSSPRKNQMEELEYSPYRDSNYISREAVNRADFDLRYSHRHLPVPASSSAALISSNHTEPVQRSASVADINQALPQEHRLGSDDVEKDNSDDDEDELRKMLLSSLAMKRSSARESETMKQDSPSLPVLPMPTDTNKNNNNSSDEEPVPPPVVKRIRLSSPIDPSEEFESNPALIMVDQQWTAHSLSSSVQLQELSKSAHLSIGASQEDTLLAQAAHKKEQFDIESPHSPALSLVPQPELSNGISVSDRDGQQTVSSEGEVVSEKMSIAAEFSEISERETVSGTTSIVEVTETLPDDATLKASCLLDQYPSRAAVSFKIKTSHKIEPQVSSSSGKSSPLRAHSPSIHAVPLNSKSISTLPSTSVIKTIYSNSQSLSHLKSTTTSTNASINRHRDQSQKSLERTKVDPLRTSSPSLSVEELHCHSSFSDPKEFITKYQKKFSTMEMPIHPSVIVPLHPSSDEDEDESTRDSDGDHDGQSFGESSNNDIKRLVSEEKSLLSHKKSIVADQEHLRRLLTKAGDALKAQRQAEATRDSLQAEIAALMEKEKRAHKMAKAHEQLKDRVKKEARQVKNTLLKSKPLFLDKTKSLMALGRVIVGPTFIPKALQPAPKLQNPKDGSEPKQMITKAQKIAIEKQMLRAKEQEIAEKLKVLKESTNSGRRNKRKASSVLIQEKPSDVIHLGQENVDILFPPKRRKSRLSTDASKTPNLPMTPKSMKSNTPGADAMRDGNLANEMKNSVPTFQMPKGSQLSNLRKILVEEKVEKVLNNNNIEIVAKTGIDFYSSFNQSVMKTKNINLLLIDAKRSKEFQDKAPLPVSLAYSSPLKMLRSYRFSKFYRTKEALSFTSKTFAHKINPNCIMCPYDLQGTCNDDNCQQQHPKDYELSDCEVLEDLVSFHPEIVGIRPGESRENIKKAVVSYVDSFLKKHKDRLTLEEMCLLLTSEIIKAAGHGKAVSTKARQWKLDAKEQRGLNINLERKSSFNNTQLFDLEKSQMADKDVLIGEEDVRYFISEGTDALSLEEAVLENPQDISLWLQLSARRIADPNRTPRECLDQALNVLARALEANRSDPDLWLQYLTLYRKHSEVNDFPQFCQTALEYAPSYELWFMYLNSLKTYHEKESACQKALEFLCRDPNRCKTVYGVDQNGAHLDKDSVVDDCDEGGANCHSAIAHSHDNCDRSKKSHQVLEMIVYYTNINILSGRFKMAIKFLQAVLEVKGGKPPESIAMGSQLTVFHTLTLWMIYIHVLEWRQLPKDLFLGANENPRRIVTQKFSLPWSSKPNLFTPLKTLVSLHSTAAKVWTSAGKHAKDADDQFVWLMKSLVSLLCTQQRFNEALSVCLKVLSESNLVDIWLTTASVYAAKQDFARVNKVFKDAALRQEYSAKLQFYQNVFLCSQGKNEEALCNLEQFILRCFDTASQSILRLDPNRLFCQILNLQEGFSLPHASEPKPGVGSNPSQSVFMWMCYCQLLEIQGETVETVDVFERSLTQVQSPHDLVLVWQSYISFLLRSEASMRSPSALQDLLVRSIISTPTKLSLPFSPTGACVVDYRYSNQIVEVWLSLLPSNQKLDVIERCLDYMPGNVPLLLRGLELCVSMKETRRAFCWCKMTAAQSEKPACLAFWKIASALAFCNGTQREVEHMLMRCAQAMPLAVSAWKDLLLFEVTREKAEIVSQILSHCEQLGLNIQDYIQTLSARVTGSTSSVVA